MEIDVAENVKTTNLNKLTSLSKILFSSIYFIIIFNFILFSVLLPGIFMATNPPTSIRIVLH